MSQTRGPGMVLPQHKVLYKDVLTAIEVVKANPLVDDELETLESIRNDLEDGLDDPRD